MAYELSHLRTLESEAIHIFREVAAEFERPVLLFSGATFPSCRPGVWLARRRTETASAGSDSTATTIPPVDG